MHLSMFPLICSMLVPNKSLVFHSFIIFPCHASLNLPPSLLRWQFDNCWGLPQDMDRYGAVVRIASRGSGQKLAILWCLGQDWPKQSTISTTRIFDIHHTKCELTFQVLVPHTINVSTQSDSPYNLKSQLSFIVSTSHN